MSEHDALRPGSPAFGAETIRSRRSVLAGALGLGVVTATGAFFGRSEAVANAASVSVDLHLPEVRVIHSGVPGQSVIALGIDDGPDPELTPMMLDVLASRGVHATFFQLGSAAERYPDLVAAVRDAGHEIGNHAWSHAHLMRISAPDAAEEVSRAQTLLSEIIGEAPKLFRPPYGEVSTPVIRAAASHNMNIALWSESLARLRVPATKRKLSDGSILLAHDGIVRRPLQAIDTRAQHIHEQRVSEIKGLGEFLDRAFNMGLRPTTISHLMEIATYPT